MAPGERREMSLAAQTDDRRRSGSISRTIMRASVDFPQPDSPTIPSVSRSRSVNETPSTACTCAIVRPNSPPRTGKCFTRLSTASSGALSA